MADVFSKKQRSEIMRAVRSKGNKSTEFRLIELFKLHHITGWRRNYKIVGQPDFVFPGKRVAIFTDGCFWHGHDCRNVTPSDNAEYWKKKIARNIERDAVITNTLTEKGWRVIRLWECELRRGEIDKLRAAGLVPSSPAGG